jgi:hypothetical protein
MGWRVNWTLASSAVRMTVFNNLFPSLKRVIKLVSLEHHHNVIISETEKNNKADESHLLTM